MIENILILDTETTGLDTRKGAEIIEIAVILFSIKYKCVLQCFSTLVPCLDNPVQNINHIDPKSTLENYPFMLEDKISNLEEIWNDPTSVASCLVPDAPILYSSIINEMNAKAQAIVAHNAAFDRKFVEAQPWSYSLSKNKWICTKENFTWPVKLTRFRLQDVCMAMNVPYIDAHRAIQDCFFLAHCFQKVEDLQERIDRC